MTADPPPVYLSADLTTANVEVDAGYSGARIGVFGAVFDPSGRPADVVVLVRGPDQPAAIARRERRAGLWLNGPPATIASAPGFHLTASNRRLAEIADPSTLQRAGAGTGSLDLSAVTDPMFARAFVRLKAREGLYLEDPAGVTFVDKGLFRARIALPASAPVGRYRVDVLLFQEGQPITRRSRELVVEKVGLERVISSFARQSPWAYGMACMLIALAAGWAASAVFRRV
jgi:uncharacterized protein (TIGR02186 family)